MSKQGKGVRLWFRKAATFADGSTRAGRWVIIDGSKQVSTGCGEGEGREAEKRLADYIASKYAPPRRERSLSEILIADVIGIYLDDVVPGQARPKKAAESALRLLEFFGELTLDKITGALCREYVAFRAAKGFAYKGTGGGARRDLEDLRAAICHHHAEGLHREHVRVVLPQRGPARQRWLTRSEVARLVWVCLSTRELQDGKPTGKRPLAHLARFILTAVYTGSRPGAILTLNWERAIGRGRVDLDGGMLYRLPEGATETAKRRPPVPIGPELLRLMQRWARQDGQRGPVVRFNGQPIQSVKVALRRACRLAGLDESVSAYTLRHTTASWLIQKGAPTRKVAEFLGTSEALIERTYAHLNPDHLRDEASLVGRRLR
jgi:integrase